MLESHPTDAGRAVAGHRHSGRLGPCRSWPSRSSTNWPNANSTLTAKAALVGQIQLREAAEAGRAIAELGRRAAALHRRLVQIGRSLSPRSAATGRVGRSIERSRTRSCALRPCWRLLRARRGRRRSAGGDSGRSASAQPNSAAAKAVLVQLGDLAIEPLLGVLGIARRGAQDPRHRSARATASAAGRAAVAWRRWFRRPARPSCARRPPRALANIVRSIARRRRKPCDCSNNAARRCAGRSRAKEATTASTPTEVWHWNAKRSQSMPIATTRPARSLADGRAAGARFVPARSRATRAARRLYLTACCKLPNSAAVWTSRWPAGAGTAYAVAAHYGADVVEDVLADAMADGLPSGGHGRGRDSGRHRHARHLLARGGIGGQSAGAGRAPRRSAAAVRGDRRDHEAQARPSPLPARATWPTGWDSSPAPTACRASWSCIRSSEEAQKLAGLAAGLGYEADIATNGRQALRAGRRSRPTMSSS